ncbi:TPA: transposase [Pseudomonas aeruginosa]|nr:transposase [Pseudomonas aeruginosa]
MTQTRRRFPESFKREAVDQVLAGTPLRHVAETLGIAESLLGKWKRQYEQQGDDAFRATASSEARARNCGVYASNWLRSPWSAMF